MKPIRKLIATPFILVGVLVMAFGIVLQHGLDNGGALLNRMGDSL